MPAAVAAFDAFPAVVRRRLVEVRRLIFETAARLDGVAPLTETLKWGEPAYLTKATGSGSSIRLGQRKSADRACAVFFNCRTTLVATFRAQFPEAFAYEGDRLSFCLAMALTYHRRASRTRGGRA
jgi:hypothetical protein